MSSASYFPTMKIKPMPSVGVSDMYNVHGYAGTLCRTAVLEGLRQIIQSRTSCMAGLPVSIADFGTADGRASLSLIKDIIDTIQTDLREETAIIVYYNDQPLNDFNLLSKVINVEGQASGLLVSNNVYPVMIPRSMYGQCLPANSLDLAISAVATHYLSKQVCQITNGVFLPEGNENEQRLMREQGRLDWRAFVISRGRELKPGGFLITLNASLDDEDDGTCHVENGNHNLGKFVSDMVCEGVITQEEYLATNFNNHYLRTAADFKEPFISAIPEIQKLRLELVSTKSIKHYLQHPVYDIVKKNDDDKVEYSRRIVASVYPWFHHVIRDGLSLSRSEDEKQAIVDNFLNRLQAYAFSHCDHKPYLIFTEVIIHKCK